MAIGTAIKGGSPALSMRQANWLLAMLTLLNILSYIDRQVLALLVGPIKADLSLSDTEMSILLGPAFGIFFAALGIPLGIVADKVSRIKLVAWSVGIWSLMTAGCGLSRNYAMLLFCRLGVGAGEAGLAPAAYSMISDMFPRERLGRALSIFALGVMIGGGLAFLLGGYAVQAAMRIGAVTVPVLGALEPWQWIFLALGVPGLVLALATLAFPHPPRPARASAIAADGDDKPRLTDESLWHFISTRKRALSGLAFGFAMLTFFGYASASWLPTMMLRVHNVSIGETGLIIGGGLLTLGVAGMLGVGWANDMLLRRGRADFPFIVAFLIGIFAIGCGSTASLTGDRTVMIVAVLGYTFLSGTWNGIASAALQIMTPPEMRGRISALYLVVINVIGLGLGPLAVGLSTDHLFGDEMAVGKSIALVGAFALTCSGAFFLWGRKAYVEATQMIR